MTGRVASSYWRAGSRRHRTACVDSTTGCVGPRRQPMPLASPPTPPTPVPSMPAGRRAAAVPAPPVLPTTWRGSRSRRNAPRPRPKATSRRCSGRRRQRLNGSATRFSAETRQLPGSSRESPCRRPSAAPPSRSRRFPPPGSPTTLPPTTPRSCATTARRTASPPVSRSSMDPARRARASSSTSGPVTGTTITGRRGVRSTTTGTSNASPSSSTGTAISTW